MLWNTRGEWPVQLRETLAENDRYEIMGLNIGFYGKRTLSAVANMWKMQRFLTPCAVAMRMSNRNSVANNDTSPALLKECHLLSDSPIHAAASVSTARAAVERIVWGDEHRMIIGRHGDMFLHWLPQVWLH